MFVSFEGCEGVGKSTQLKLLKDYLEATGQHAVYVREPGSTEISEQIRKVILNPQNTAMTDMTEALLYAASRAQLVREVIKPALERGELVVCDRYVDSSIAYQGYARGLGTDTIKQINAPAMDGCLPDVTIFLDLRPSQSWRTFKIQDDRMELESSAFHDKVYEGYINEIETSNGRFVRIKPDFDRNVTSQRIIDALRERGAIK